MILLLLAVSLAVLAVGLVLRRRAQEQFAELSVAGDVVYADSGAAEVLVSNLHGLAGKPDYVRKEGGEPIPVERKSRVLSASGAYEGEVLQLAAYCLLVEERFGRPVMRGQLLYQNTSLDVTFDDQLRSRLFDALATLRAAEQSEDVGRSHNSRARCRGCGFRRVCGDSLA
jgi:CRISPR-associated exonuclease Cas4